MDQEWIDFIKNQYFLVVYFITWVISMISYKKYFNTILKYFPILIAYTFLNELLGYFIKTDYFSFFSDAKYLNANDLIYNLYTLIFFGFFYFLYWKLVESEKFKTWISIASGVTLLSFIVRSFFQNPILMSLYYVNIIASARKSVV